MPYQEIWVAPELFLSHNGVNVYHTYGDDNINDGPKNYWFTAKPSEPEGENESFDMRELNVPSRTLLDRHPPFISLSMPDDEQEKLRALWNEWQGPNGETQAIRLVIMEAIDSGLIVAGEDNAIEASGVGTALTAMLDLKPCPFCGTLNLDFTSNGHENHYVECAECGCSGPPGIDNTDAAATWNMRG